MSNVLGFEIRASGSGGDFIPIVKYDARAGRLFRVDRVQLSDGTFGSEPVDITATFKAIADFDNAQSGWMEFSPGKAPTFVLVPLADLKAGKLAWPERPSETARQGFRFLMKLNKVCGGDRQIREIAGNSSAFLNGIAQVYEEYERTRGQYPNQLPVITLASTTPVKSGSGQMSSTNYQPSFKISGWAPRPDDLKASAPPLSAPIVQPLPAHAPVTGNATVPPPNILRAPQLADDDFG